MTRQPRLTIDLNCDLGEGGPHDAELMPLVSSANIACGGHACDAATMAAAVALARRHGVAIGGHPGHVDREHFGRRELPITPAEAAALVIDQVAALEALAGEPPRHVKLHGGLYHQVGRDEALGEAVVQAILARWPCMVLVAFAGSPLVAVARRHGLAVAEEAFLDRAYAADGSLLPRSQPGAMIDDPHEAAARAVRLVCEGVVEAIDGRRLPITADTLCIHGDGATSLAIARAVREAFDRAGIVVAPRGGP
jgi:5-oxoprolinase (ATP-hydrolysing) subunit A